MKIDWKRKLTSRKFWMAVALFVSGLLVAIGKDKSQAETISGLIMQGAAVIAYIIGEGLTDQSFLSNVGTEYLVNSLKELDHDEESSDR